MSPQAQEALDRVAEIVSALESLTNAEFQEIRNELGANHSIFETEDEFSIFIKDPRIQQ